MDQCGTYAETDFYERNLDVLEYDDGSIVSEDDSRSPSPESDVDLTLESLESDRFSSEATLLRIFSLENESYSFMDYGEVNLNFSLPNLELSLNDNLRFEEFNAHGFGQDRTSLESQKLNSFETNSSQIYTGNHDTCNLERNENEGVQQGVDLPTEAKVLQLQATPTSANTEVSQTSSTINQSSSQSNNGILAYCRKRGFEYNFQKSVYSRISDAATTCGVLSKPEPPIADQPTFTSSESKFNDADDEESIIGVDNTVCSVKSEISEDSNYRKEVRTIISKLNRNNSLKLRNASIFRFLRSKGLIPLRDHSYHSDTELFNSRASQNGLEYYSDYFSSQCSKAKSTARSSNHARSQSLIENSHKPMPTYLNYFLSNSSLLSDNSLIGDAKLNHSIQSGSGNIDNTLEDLLDYTLENLSISEFNSNFSTMSHQSNSDVIRDKSSDVIDNDEAISRRKFYREAMTAYCSSVSQVCSDYWSRSSSCEANIDVPAKFEIPSHYLNDRPQQNGIVSHNRYGIELCTKSETDQRFINAELSDDLSFCSTESEHVGENLIESNSDVDLSLFEDRSERSDPEFESEADFSSEPESRPGGDDNDTTDFDVYYKNKDEIVFDFISGTFHDNVFRSIASDTRRSIKFPTDANPHEINDGIANPRDTIFQVEKRRKLYTYDVSLDDDTSINDSKFSVVPVNPTRSPRNMTCQSNPNMIRLSKYQIKNVRSD